VALLSLAIGVVTAGSDFQFDKLKHVPLHFEANCGQTSERVSFLARGDGYTLFLTPGEVVLATPPGVLRMRLAGANLAARVEPQQELPGKSNYFIGNDPARWRRNISNYSKVRYRGVYPGVDVVYYGNQGELEYDFVLAPGRGQT